jgi:hypothetical protein
MNITTLKKYAADVIQVGVVVAAVLVVVLNVAGAVHLPAADVAYISVAAGVVAAVVNQLKAFVGAKVAQGRAARN